MTPSPIPGTVIPMQTLAILWSYLATRHRPRFRGRDALERWQDRRVRRHLRRVLPASPYYRERFGGAADWRDAPTTDKAAMMAEFDRLNTVGVGREEALGVALEAESSRDFAPMVGRITVGLSSGTSGSRGVFLASPAERARWAGTILAKALPSSLLIGPRHRIAFFLRANSNLYDTVRSRRVRFEFFDLMAPLEDHLARLDALAPTVLVAPPSMLRMLSEARNAGALAATPGKVISVAEVLDPLDAVHIARAFGGPIHQIYQATEGLLGTTCAHGTLHLAEDGLVIQREYLDPDHTRFTPVITDFRRVSQPILRYRLDDVLVLRPEPCPCGSVMTALDCVEGRADDLFYLPPAAGGPLRPVFPDFVRRAIIAASDGILAYGVRQVAADGIELFLRVRPGGEPSEIRRAAVQALDELWRRLGCRVPAVRFVEEWARGGMRKLKRVERCFEPGTEKESG